MRLNEEIEQTLSQIPELDRQRIAYFFRHAIFWDSYGYVLLGSKPCAIGSYRRITRHPTSWLEYLAPHNWKIRQGWKTWQKHECKFPHPQFVFLEENPSVDMPVSFVILVRRDRFLQQVEAHQVDFDTVLGRRVTGEELLMEGQRYPFFRHVLKNHDGLIGTVLGYGRNNGWLFQERSPRLRGSLDPIDNGRMREFCATLSWMDSLSGPLVRDLSYVPLPGFKVDPEDPTTAQLRMAYLREQKKIIAYYKSGDFLTLTLQILCEPISH